MGGPAAFLAFPSQPVRSPPKPGWWFCALIRSSFDFKEGYGLGLGSFPRSGRCKLAEVARAHTNGGAGGGGHQYGMLCHSNVGTLSTAKGRRGCLASANRKLFMTVSLYRGTRQVQPLVPPISCRSSRCWESCTCVNTRNFAPKEQTPHSQETWPPGAGLSVTFRKLA